MHSIDQEFRARLNRLTGRERVALAVSLLEEVCVMVRRKILEAEPGHSERELQKRVASALYRTDPATQELIARMDP